MANANMKAVVVRDGTGDSMGALGVNIKFLTVGAQSEGQYMTMEYTAPPHFAGPPPHYHGITTEFFHVMQGTLVMRIGDLSVNLGPGGYAYVPPGVVHVFSNPTDAPTVYFCLASPAGLEHYFAELAQLVKDEPQWPPKDMSQVLALMARYDTFPPPQQA